MKKVFPQTPFQKLLNWEKDRVCADRKVCIFGLAAEIDKSARVCYNQSKQSQRRRSYETYNRIHCRYIADMLLFGAR